MDYYRPRNWDEIPDVITKEQFYKICHISKSTALYLLRSGLVPCEYSGKKTRCYKIKKDDVQKYLESKAKYPECFVVAKGWYGGKIKLRLQQQLSDEAIKKLNCYYTDLLKEYRDVMTVNEITKLTGYAKTAINNWCYKNQLKHFSKGKIYFVPKVFLIGYLCSNEARSIKRKTFWHIQTLNEFHSLMQQEKRKHKSKLPAKK